MLLFLYGTVSLLTFSFSEIDINVINKFYAYQKFVIKKKTFPNFFSYYYKFNDPENSIFICFKKILFNIVEGRN